MNTQTKIAFFISVLLLSFSANSQLVTNTGISPAALVEDVLLGDGVEVSGVTYTGAADAIGSFNGTATNVGLASGIILTTGTVNNETGGIGGEQRGPFGPNDTGSAGKSNGEPGYGPLTEIAGVETENAAILEFDFIPQSDTIRFRYVFGSDEYPEFVDEGFNDAFAFFISGPGFGGTYNMAQIPGGGGPVSIDNINNGPSNSGPCQNCSFYNANGTGATSPYDSDAFYIQYDGFTTVMEAVAKVECGETYHLKIAIADAGDQAYDSGIFLEANSLASYGPLEMSANLDLNGYGDGVTMAEGCESATVTVNRTHTAEALSLPVLISGTATEGIDYENIPDDINFAIGQATVTFTFDVLSDALIEGIENLVIELNYPDPCGEDNFVAVELFIQDVDPLEATIDDIEVHCPEEEVELTVNITGGLPDYTYDWDIGGTDPSITVSPGVTTTYTVTVNDICIGIPVTVSGTIIVPVYPPLDVNTTPDTSVLCPNTPVVLISEPFGGEGTYTYEWFDGGSLLSSGPFVNVSPYVTTTYTLVITDGCGTVLTKEITVTVIASVLELEMSPDQLVCPGDTANIWVIATEGLGDYTYYWMHSGETTADVDVTPNYTTSYTVSVEDACHTYSVEGTTTVEVVRPDANFNILSNDPMENLLVSFQNTTVGGVTWDWDLGNGDVSNLHSPSSTYSPWGWYEVTLIAYNEIGCSDTVTKPLYIKPEFYFYAPNAFTPDDGRFNNYYGVSVIGAIDFKFQIFNRWGELIYQTTDQYFKWDGTYNGHNVPDDVVVYKVQITDREYQIYEYEGMITILR
ncbi:MAG: T9SS type B sorting domain-containing protein [Crocinitomix sp.]|nr:T9SS type B sorting domain-containing protein [Crocinitomix sp.]